MRVILVALLAFLPIAAAEPKPDPNTVMLPTFIFDQRHAITAGVAFAFEESGQRYLATAYHILGPAGGLKTKLTPREVASELKAVAGLCLGDAKTVMLAQPALYLEDTRAFDEKGGEADLVLARVVDVRGVTPLKLAKTPPKKGDQLWLFVRLVDRDRPTLYRATVVDSTPTFLQYELEDQRLNLRAASGAPVLAADGTVVALHLGYGQQNTALIGIGNPVSAIRERLTAALAAPKKP